MTRRRPQPGQTWRRRDGQLADVALRHVQRLGRYTLTVLSSGAVYRVNEAGFVQPRRQRPGDLVEYVGEAALRASPDVDIDYADPS